MEVRPGFSEARAPYASSQRYVGETEREKRRRTRGPAADFIRRERAFRDGDLHEVSRYR
jgi:hypothetical protein